MAGKGRVAILKEALEWAIAEIEGRTRYDSDEQQDNALQCARDALDVEQEWIVGSYNGDNWRVRRNGNWEWTTHRGRATRYSSRDDAEDAHLEDEDAGRVVRYTRP